MLVYPKESEKRQHRRLPAISLSADIKLKKGLFTRWLNTKGLDFNIYGIALVLPHEPELGTKMSMKLALTMDMVEVKVDQLEAKVVNKMMINADKGEWRVGFIFSGQSKLSSETKKQLARINDYLERNNTLKGKLSE
ncbi:MAG: hypothetical protein ACMZ64_03830 [Oleiphilus sp.]